MHYEIILNKGQSTTAKPIEIPEEIEAEEEDALEDSQEHETPTTTTESAKKLRNGGVRPFRYYLFDAYSLPQTFHINNIKSQLKNTHLM